MNESNFDINKYLQAMAAELVKVTGKDALMIGIHTGGYWVAQKLHESMQLKTPLGQLNITFYRDDFSQIGLHPRVKPSNLPFDVDNKEIILVDDVLHTGRTIRAALNEIFDYGRPRRVVLAVLVDRDGRELPVAADVTGKRLSLKPDEHVKLSGPEPLALEIKKAE